MTIIAGNFKMHGRKEMLARWMDQVLTHANVQHPRLTWIVFPPSILLAQTEHYAKNTALKWGAQNLSDYEEGAYTGELSAGMLSDHGCQYVLIGHSERRHLFGETDEQIAQKCLRALSANLTPILCLGETLAARDQQKTEAVLQQQMCAVVDTIGIHACHRMLFAYEPVWAIGTGRTATPEIAQVAHAFIKKTLSNYDKTVSSSIKILYGGSVKPDNTAGLLRMPDVDGVLVGGASLDPTQFLAIGEACIKSF